MKHTLASTVGIACLIEPRARAVRFGSKMGEGKISTAAMALILARSGEPISRNTGFADARCWYSSDLAANEFAHAEEPRKHINPSRIFHRSSTLNEGTFSV